MASNFLKPEFFIIGERKCGTSSLYRYLLDHPRIIPCKVKEPQFFSRSSWYRWTHWKQYQALFPLIGDTEPVELDWFVLDEQGELGSEKVTYPRRSDVMEMTGEASANTFAQVPPARLHTYFPDAKTIVLLRNPTERAYSHYRMFERFKKEGRRLPFELTTFEKDAQCEIKAHAMGKRTYFIGPGVYHKRLQQWYSEFGSKGVHVIFTENLDNHESALVEMNLLCRFLGLEAHDFDQILKLKFNTSPVADMPASTRAELNHFYSNDRVKLVQLLHSKLPWK